MNKRQAAKKIFAICHMFDNTSHTRLKKDPSPYYSHYIDIYKAPRGELQKFTNHIIIRFNFNERNKACIQTKHHNYPLGGGVLTGNYGHIIKLLIQELTANDNKSTEGG